MFRLSSTPARGITAAVLLIAVLCGTRTPAVAAPLPTPWQWSNVGNVAPSGTASWTTSGTFSIQAGGPDIGGTADGFGFVFQTLTGDGVIVCRVDSLLRTQMWAKAGLMIREDLGAGAKYVSVVATPTKGLLLLSRTATGGTATQTATAAGVPPRWLKLTRSGQTVTAAASTDGVNWATVGSQSINLASVTSVGLAVTSRTTRSLTTAAISNVTVTPTTTTTPPPANQPPTVSLTLPKPGTSYTSPAAIVLQATAADSDGTVARVDFYANSALIGSATSSPYSVTWSGVAAGSYRLEAVARDNLAATKTCTAVDVTVTAPANRLPSVTLTSPAPYATFNAPAAIAMTASASDTDGTITRVDFYNGSNKIGSATASPYSATWANAPAGNYQLTAVAWDNSGASATCASVPVTVNAATLPGELAFTPSVDDQLVVSYTVEFFPGGANPSTTPATSSRNIGKPAPVNGTVTVDVLSSVQALPPGTYFVTVSSNGTSGSNRSQPSETFVR